MGIALGVLLVASVFQGSFGICFKKYQPFSWEAFWALFSIVGVLLTPHIWASIEVPDYMKYIWATPPPDLIFGASMGFLWGVSAIWYSKAISKIGVSLVTGINLGLSLILGTFIPMLILRTTMSPIALVTLIIGMAVLVAGTVVLAKAGFMKNLVSATPQTVGEGSEPGVLRGGNREFLIGFAMAFASGIGSAAINIGASASNVPVKLAIAEGVSGPSASLLAWVVVFAGGFVANFGYSVYVLLKKKTYISYIKPGAPKAYGKVLLTSFVWFAALAVYGKATNLLGDLGPIIGWSVFNALALIIANLWGFLDGEWKGFVRARRVSVLGNLIIVGSLVIIGIANNL